MRAFGAVLWAGAGFAATAEAQMPIPTCDSLLKGIANASRLYVAGPADAQGSAGPLAAAVGFAEVTSSRLVYVGVPSCLAMQDVMTRAAGAVTASYISSSSGGVLTACTASGHVPDMAISDVYPDTCAPGLLTAAQADFLGPVNVAAFVVPFSSTEQAISADAAYVVFGFGATQYAVKPWTDPNSIFTPQSTSGPLSLAGAVIGLDRQKWVNAQTSLAPLSAEVKAIAGGKANASIGILPAQTAESTPTTLRILAYQHTGQGCGYPPDSDGLHADRINVRQGRYALWGPLHFVTNVDSMGNPVDHTGQRNASLRAITSLLVATGPQATGAAGSITAMASDGSVSSTTKQALFLAEATAGLVPWCAMRVTRSSEGGAEASFAPAEPCGCAFENTVGATLGTTRCATCLSDADCSVAARHCSYGYCEAM